MQPNKTQREALKWLREHNGVVLAAGESAPFARSTWNALRDLGLVEIYRPDGRTKGRPRLRLSEPARQGDPR